MGLYVCVCAVCEDGRVGVDRCHKTARVCGPSRDISATDLRGKDENDVIVIEMICVGLIPFGLESDALNVLSLAQSFFFFKFFFFSKPSSAGSVNTAVLFKRITLITYTGDINE